METTPVYGIQYAEPSDFTADYPVEVDEPRALLLENLLAQAMPVGAIVPWSGIQTAPIPIGWLLCDGTAVLREEYPNLFLTIDIAYGVGDGVTTFNLPNLMSKTPVGYDAGTFATIGQTGGEVTHVLTEAELASHAHGVSDPGHTHMVINEYNGMYPVLMNDTSQDSSGSGRLYIREDWATNGFGMKTAHVGTGVGVYAAGGNVGHNNMPPYIVMRYLIKT